MKRHFASKYITKLYFESQEELTNDPFPSVGFGQYRQVKAPTATSKNSSSTSSSYESSSAGGYGPAHGKRNY